MGAGLGQAGGSCCILMPKPGVVELLAHTVGLFCPGRWERGF